MTRNYIELVGKTLSVLEALDSASGTLTVTELSKATGMAKSTVFRILYSLKAHGYVDQKGPLGQYFLTSKVSQLGRTESDQEYLRSVARPRLESLLSRFNETVALAVLENKQPIVAELCESTHPVRVVTSMAAVSYFHSSSLGKAMAAFLPRKQVEETLDIQRMPKLTKNTITSRSKLFLHLEDVRKHGYAVNFEEGNLGAIYIAAPILGSDGFAVGALAVGLPKIRYTKEREKEIARALKNICADISSRLGVRKRSGSAPDSH